LNFPLFIWISSSFWIFNLWHASRRLLIRFSTKCSYNLRLVFFLG
jgi:hypothetical protein